jgi:hypothetical protein
MPIESEEQKEVNLKDLMPQESNIKVLIPLQKSANLQQRQETTSGKLATFLIYILAGTLTASTD